MLTWRETSEKKIVLSEQLHIWSVTQKVRELYREIKRHYSSCMKPCAVCWMECAAVGGSHKDFTEAEKEAACALSYISWAGFSISFLQEHICMTKPAEILLLGAAGFKSEDEWGARSISIDFKEPGFWNLISKRGNNICLQVITTDTLLYFLAVNWRLNTQSKCPSWTIKYQRKTTSWHIEDI